MLSLAGSGVEILLACIQDLSNLREMSLNNCRMLRSILGLPPTFDKLQATDCTSLETIRCSSPFKHQFLDHGCWLDFRNTAKLDEPSLLFIEKLIQCSITAAAKRLDSYTACYLGSSVPNWMRYKQTAVASNTIEFTCKDEQSLMGMMFCCVLPSTPMDTTLCCNYSDDSNLKFKS